MISLDQTDTRKQQPQKVKMHKSNNDQPMVEMILIQRLQIHFLYQNDTVFDMCDRHIWTFFFDCLHQRQIGLLCVTSVWLSKL